MDGREGVRAKITESISLKMTMEVNIQARVEYMRRKSSSRKWNMRESIVIVKGGHNQR